MKKPRLILILSLMSLGVHALTNNDSKNVLGTALEQHNNELLTGFYRDGYCRTGFDDKGMHVVAAIVTKEFLRFTKAQGNDLQTPNPEFHFPGLKPGDRWCLCATRWLDAEHAGVAPPIDLKATHEKALNYIPLEILKKHHEE